jgi:hypothetical protein
VLQSSQIQLANSFDRKVLLIYTAIVLDAVATVWLITQGFGEANPVMNWVIKHWSISGMAIAKILWSLFLMGFVLRWKEFKRYIDYLIIGYFLLYVGGWLIQLIMETIS